MATDAGGRCRGAAVTAVTAVIDGPIDATGFRRHARALLAQGVEPHRVCWSVKDADAPGLFDATEEAGRRTPDDARPADTETLRVPSSFAALADTVLLHRDPGRLALLYRLLWRLRHEPGYWQDTMDVDRVLAESMARAVRRDQHKMKAFVRFRPIARDNGLPPLQVAWFEPEHHVVEAVAPFFARRFTQMCWTVLTPLRSVSWDGQHLAFADGASRTDAPDADAGESLWLTYYRHIFNPARLNTAAMCREMPRRYWKNLPEATLIAPLAAHAVERTAGMLLAAPTPPARTTVAAKAMASGRRACHPATADQPLDRDRGTQQPSAWPGAARDAAAHCRCCPLYRDATQVVLGEGPAQARWMFVGEQPDDQDDLQGRPFVGPAGRLFDWALTQLGIARDAVYVTHAVKHFKFELRGRRRLLQTPAQQELAACLDWLDREIAQVCPKVIVALGATAAQALLGRPVAVMQLRGQWLWRDDGLPVLVTLPPAALLQWPPDARQAALQRWVDDLAHALRPPEDRPP